MKSYSLPRKIVVAVCLLLLATLLLSCAKTNKFIMNGSSFRDKKTDVTYLDAPPSIEAITVSDREYGKSGDILFYEIEGLDPTKFVCEQSGTVFYAEDLSIPTLADMTLSFVQIRIEETTPRTLSTMDSREDAEEIRAAYLQGEAISYPAHTPVRNLRVRLCDESLGLCYSLVYVEYEKDYITSAEDGSEINHGRCFLYNRFESRFVKAPELLIAQVAQIYGDAA